jgi:hypothetical protein
LRLRSRNHGRDQMYPWGHPPEQTPPAYAVGDTVYSDATAGTVVAVGADAISVVWSDGDGGAIVYPIDATYLRRKLPWE